jgi:radical SAM protein with 4Fe4S-binding SPASM domain
LTTSFITNGTLLRRKNADELIDAGLTELGVSINSLKEQSFTRFRSGASLDGILDGVQGLITARNRRQSAYPKVDIWAVLMRDETESAQRLVRMAPDIGVDRINFLDYLTGLGEPGNDGQRLQRSTYASLIKDLVRTGRRHGVAVVNNKYGTGRGACLHPWLAPFISAEGYVMPCCFIPEHSVINFGNIFQSDFRSIWSSHEYVSFRRDFKTRRPSVCATCPCY